MDTANNFYTPTPSRRRILLVVVASLALLVVVALAFNSWVLKSSLDLKVEMAGASGKAEVVVIKQSSGEQIAKGDISLNETKGWRLQPGEYSFSASKDSSESVGFIKLERFQKAQLKLNLSPQRSLNKIGSESLGCDISRDSVLYSYSCTNTSAILKHVNSPDKFVNAVALDNGSQQIPVAKPYLAGLLAKYKDDVDTNLYYLELSASRWTPITMPAGINLEATTTVTDEAGNASNERFVLADNSKGKIYVYATSKAQPIELKLPGGAEQPEAIATSYSLLGDQLLIFNGAGEYVGEDDEEENAYEQIKNNFLYIADLSQPKVSIKTIKLDRDTILIDLHAINKDHIVVRKKTGAVVYKIKPGGLGTIANIEEVNTLSVTTNNNFLYVKGQAIYEYSLSTNQAQKVFSSPRWRPSQVSNDGSATLFNAFLENDSSNTLHSFAITSEALGDKRLEDSLPYRREDGLPILKMDYTASTIKVQLGLSSLTSNRQTGQVSYDLAEFIQAKDKVLEKLAQDGIDLNKFQVYFTI